MDKNEIFEEGYDLGRKEAEIEHEVARLHLNARIEQARQEGYQAGFTAGQISGKRIWG